MDYTGSHFASRELGPGTRWKKVARYGHLTVPLPTSTKTVTEHYGLVSPTGTWSPLLFNGPGSGLYACTWFFVGRFDLRTASRLGHLSSYADHNKYENLWPPPAGASPGQKAGDYHLLRPPSQLSLTACRTKCKHIRPRDGGTINQCINSNLSVPRNAKAPAIELELPKRD